MRDLMSKPKNSANSAADSSATGGSGPGEGENSKKMIFSLVNESVCGAILDTSFSHMVKKEKLLPETVASLGVLELWSDDIEGKGEFSQYRSRLVCYLYIYVNMSILLYDFESTIFYVKWSTSSI